MQYFTIISVLLALVGLVTLAQGSTIPVAPGLPMNVTTMKWTGPSKGINITLEGTASEIAAQLKALDPDWTPPAPRDGIKNITEVSSNLAARQTHEDSPGTRFCCPVNVFVPVNWWGVIAGVYNIDAIASGFASTSVAPYSCNLVNCGNGAGIYLCNGEGVTFDINMQDIGYYADLVALNCPQSVSANDLPMVCGQQFDVTGWNVVINKC